MLKLSEKAVFKDDRSPFYQYRFSVGGRKLQGSTGLANETKARKHALEIYRQAKKDLNELPHSTLRGLTIEQAVARYIQDVVSTWRNENNRNYADTYLGDIVTFFGPSRALASIDEEAVRALARHRKSQTCGGRTTQRHRVDAKRMITAPEVTNATVNRTTIEPLKYIMALARGWKVPDLQDIPWSKIRKAYKEDVKPRNFLEPNALAPDALEPDYMRFVDFLRISGLRFEECFLEKSQVGERHIRTIIKGGEIVDHPISDEMRRILMVAMANPTDRVFAYTATRGGKHGRKGEVKPLTPAGLHAAWQRARRKGTIPASLRLHDLRHSFAMELLRETGNAVVVQRALHHKRIETTMRYARVLDEDLLAGMNRLQGRNRPETAGQTAGNLVVEAESLMKTGT
jgi:integrase